MKNFKFLLPALAFIFAFAAALATEASSKSASLTQIIVTDQQVPCGEPVGECTFEDDVFECEDQSLPLYDINSTSCSLAEGRDFIPDDND